MAESIYSCNYSSYCFFGLVQICELRTLLICSVLDFFFVLGRVSSCGCSFSCLVCFECVVNWLYEKIRS